MSKELDTYKSQKDNLKAKYSTAKQTQQELQTIRDKHILEL
jgi:hypothetical protein